MNNVLIVDDHALFREGLKVLLDKEKDFHIVGEAGDGAEAIEFLKKNKVDIITLDISLPDKNGIQLIPIIKKLVPETKIMMVSMYSKIEYVTEAFNAGALGYVLKESAAEKLIRGLNTIVKGEQYLDNVLSTKLMQKLTQPKEEDNVGNYNKLTRREQEIMRLLAEGIHVKDIAEKLNITPKTVENHRSNIMHKLSLSTSIDLVKYAARIGIIDIDSWMD